MKCCNSCIHGDSTNNICHTCIGSKYEVKSVEEQDTTNNLDEFLEREIKRMNYTHSCDK